MLHQFFLQFKNYENNEIIIKKKNIKIIVFLKYSNLDELI